jgi:hypothetical protein
MNRHLAAALILSSPLAPGATAEGDGFTPPSGLNFFTGMNVARVDAIASSGMSFDNSPAEIENFTFEVGAILSRPVECFAGYSMLPFFRYEANFLRPDGVPAGIPLGDEDLHEIDFSLFLYKMEAGSRWLSGAWINPSLATDFESLSGDDFFLDLAGGAGYRVSDQLIVGAGIGALNLTGDTAVYPGIGFLWSPREDLFVAFYGPNFRAGWEATDAWRLGFEVRPNGGIWNIDSAGGSRNIDFSSFRVGLGSSHRLTEKMWLTYGGGVTVGNALNITSTDGSDLYKNRLDDLDTGFYGFLSLSLKAW